jgi:hypothetical protein
MHMLAKNFVDQFNGCGEQAIFESFNELIEISSLEEGPLALPQMSQYCKIWLIFLWVLGWLVFPEGR